MKCFMKKAMAVSIATLLASPATYAQETSVPAAPTTAPTLSDTMTQQQLRHIKLWFAGTAGNWPLADFELDKLQDGFEVIDAMIGGGTVAKEVGAPIAELERAIAGKDRAAFRGAFDRLSGGCNSCHMALGRSFIVIKRPTMMPYSDQSFAPRKR